MEPTKTMQTLCIESIQKAFQATSQAEIKLGLLDHSAKSRRLMSMALEAIRLAHLALLEEHNATD